MATTETPPPIDEAAAAALKAANNEIGTLNAEVNALKAANTKLAKDLADTQKRLRDAKAAPTGNVVVLDGVTYPVKDTHRADNTFVEVKRGHCGEGNTLVEIERTH